MTKEETALPGMIDRPIEFGRYNGMEVMWKKLR